MLNFDTSALVAPVQVGHFENLFRIYFFLQFCGVVCWTSYLRAPGLCIIIDTAGDFGVGLFIQYSQCIGARGKIVCKCKTCNNW